MSTNWNWTYICPTGLTPWLPEEKYLTPCFQQICLQVPALVLFAIVSVYHVGHQTVLVRRNRTQILLIYLRAIAAFMFAALSFYDLFHMIRDKLHIWPIDVMLNCVEIFTWMIHLGTTTRSTWSTQLLTISFSIFVIFVYFHPIKLIGFLLSLRNHGGLSQRGPLCVLVIWICNALLAGVWMRTSQSIDRFECAVIALALHAIYAFSLLFGGRATFINRRTVEADERQSLIGNTYVRFQDDVQIMALGQAQDEAPFLSRVVFYWVNPLIEKGLMGNLRRLDDLFDLPESLNIYNNIEHVQNALERTRSLLRTLHKVFGFEFYTIGILRFVGDMSGFAGPLLLAALLNHKNSDQTGTDLKAYGYAFGLFGVTLIGAFFGTHFNWRMSLISLKMRIGITTAIYRKTLEAQSISGDNPEVLNLMSTDTDRIVNSCISFHSFWSIPFQLFTTLYLLYTQIGVAFIAGVIFAATLIPINRWLAKKIAALSVSLLEAKDARVSQSVEALAAAKQIKTLAWEDVFIDKIQNLRERELKSLSKRKYLDAMCVYFWATTPIIINLLTFSASTFLGLPMTAATTFASVALLNMLIGPLNAFPWVLNGLVEAWISLKRVQTYLDLPNVNLERFYSPLLPETLPQTEPEPSRKPIILSVKSATFAYKSTRMHFDDDGDDDQDHVLKAISCDIKKGDLVCLEGPVGGGKSALLNAINGNLIRTSGFVHIGDFDAGFGYVAQCAWLQHGTIRENIVWGECFDEIRYKKVLWSCALHRDLEEIGGDLFDIGEGGCTLSGGQRARVALARAVYQEKEIYLIDDVLAALDAHVANHVVRHCILGLLKDRTRIIVTDNRTLYYYANQILHVENGGMTQSDFALGSLESDLTDDEAEYELNTSHNFVLSNEINESSDTQETREYGTLSSRVLSVYWKACGPGLGVVIILTIVLMQASKNLSDAWLAHWIANVTPSNTDGLNPKLLGSNYYMQEIRRNLLCMIEKLLSLQSIDNCADTGNGLRNGTFSMSFYLLIYFIIAVFNSMITLVRAFAFAYAGLKAAKFIHTKLLNSVFYSEFSFFDVTPLGRILNRFSSDTYTIDDTLPFILNVLLAQLAGLIGAICISLYAMPWLMLLIVPMVPVYLSLQSRYRHSSRDIKRLSSNSLSPIYTHFTETVQGLATIRAMRGSNRFHRDFLTKLEDSIRAQLTASSAQQWLGLRMQLLGAILVGGSGFIAVITSADATTPEMVGLVISYSLSITGLLSGVLNAMTETEQELIAVERVHNYCKVKPEVNAPGSQDPPFGWPCQGVIKFEDVTMKYRSYLQPSLNRMDFQTSSCERIGIVGRTGAGKSSILAALIRMAPLTTGNITIDTVDVATLPLHILRSRIALVPQDSFLFSGTIRENMDPRNLHLDSDIWDAINRCLAAPLVQTLGGLNAYLDTRGSNISTGQKQLLCLARALLRKSKIVVIDEGTANLDSDSENAIQLVLRNSFKSSTVLLIAHRLHGLQQTDRIFVIENGQIIEDGKPQELARDKSSRFYAMLEEQQTPGKLSRTSSKHINIE